MATRHPITARAAGALLAVAALLAADPAAARSRHHARHHHASRSGGVERTAAAGEGTRSGAHVIQCVAFARADTGIELSGNARNWWDNAAGVYDRGDAPEVGSVLSFRANPRMRLGHVAVVSNVVGPRVVQIDQSHWASGGISRNISVVDVSPENDWSQVRVALGHGANYGAIYPTDGFIYPRPDRGGVIRPAAIRDAMPITVASADIAGGGTTGADMAGTDTVDAANAAAQDAEDLGRSRHRRIRHRRHEIAMEVAEAPDASVR